ncbi:MHC class II antigen presentation inhibitor [Eptesipox virus]|uniref:MHC class II antigen presentation inhibitor n=1 Tax=Eptesipox virus TaxID=1329402 RepID=A0A220T6K1_9POXV|nr:MHC class II antigen presentation inhibitor [Eptesipox virus]ASK51333.1 MHC class II antigen presentation inhibitor [Eptesipox virus]WAH71091.1 MHC class II antigen presentation inhibitor [Eptesipox virus]
MSAKYLYTPLGAICYNTDEEYSFICSNIGITSVSSIGPYKLATFDIKHIDISNINVDYLENFYLSFNGILVHCSKINRVTNPITNIYHAFVANKNLIIVCDFKPITFIKDGIKFYVENNKNILTCSVLEIYNYKNNYEFILNPSKEFLKEIYLSCHICFSDNNGWIIADCKK